jgi:hypothetical protein
MIMPGNSRALFLGIAASDPGDSDTDLVCATLLLKMLIYRCENSSMNESWIYEHES